MLEKFKNLKCVTRELKKGITSEGKAYEYYQYALVLETGGKALSFPVKIDYQTAQVLEQVLVVDDNNK